MRAATRADLRSWQREALVALAGVLEAAAVADLEPLTWRVDATKGLRGDVQTAGLSVAEARATWQAWVEFIGAEPQRRPWSVSTLDVARVGAYRPPGVGLRDVPAVEVVVVLDPTLCAEEPT